jgi:hypothetical protein
MAKQFDYQGAKQAGYSDEEINQFLSEKHSNFDFQAAQEAGYSPAEINDFLSNHKPKRNMAEKAGRIATQYGVGALENALLPYEIGVLPLAMEGGQEALGDLFTRDVLSEVYPTEEEGKNVGPRELREPVDIGVRSLLEKGTGLDLKPEGALEKAASWIGFIKKPGTLKSLINAGLKPKETFKALMPLGEEVFRGLGAGTALEIAEDGNFGPIGTISSAVLGDVLGSGIKGLGKAVLSPKKSLAKLASKFTKSENSELQKQLINDFRQAGIQADIGTITDSNILKWMQTRLSQSSLVGKDLENFKKQLTDQVKEEYKKLADGLGEAKFSTLHEASEVGKEYLTEIRNAEKSRISKIYDKAEKSLPENASINPIKIASVVDKLERALKPGSVKSTEQKAVLDVLEKFKGDLYDSSGKLKDLAMKDLLNNKKALGEIVDFEIQGGQKQLLKNLISELDKAALSYGVGKSQFPKLYSEANQDFSKFAKTFRNKNIDRILRSEDPSVLMNKMNTVQGIRELKKALNITPEGKNTFNNLKRLKFDQMIGDKMISNTSEQLKLGTFSNLLKNPKDKQLAIELLGKESFAKLERLQKATGKLAESAQKFFNASQSGVTVIDMALIGNALKDIGMLLAGNPWPFVKTSSGFLTAKGLSKLMADPEFLKLVEDAMLAASKNDIPKMVQVGRKLQEPLKAAYIQSNQQTN